MENGLRCPLCLDGYSRPRKLPDCRHSFCTTCIHAYAQSCLKENPGSKFTCPVCLIEFHGPKNEESVVSWVKGLSLNYHLMIILQKKNERKIFPCEPCDTRCKDLSEIDIEGKECASLETSSASCDSKKAPNADYFCSVCEEAYCESCSKVHKSSRATMSHELVLTSRPDIEEVVLRSGTEPFCTEHPCKKIEYYCNNHEQFLCAECALSIHKTCNSLEDSNMHSTKLSVAKIMEETDVSFLQAQTYLDNILKALQAQTDGVTSKLEKFKNEVARIKLSLKENLDEFERLYLESFKCILKQTENAVRASTEKIKCLAAAFETEKTVLKTVTEKSLNSEVGVFCQSKRQNLRRDIQMLGEQIKTETPILKYQFSSGLQELLSPDFKIGTLSLTTECLNAESLLAASNRYQGKLGSHESVETTADSQPHTNNFNMTAVLSTKPQNQGNAIKTTTAKEECCVAPTNNTSCTGKAKGRSRSRRKKRVFTACDV